VKDDARSWQRRPLDDVYPVVFLDCMGLQIREGGSVQRRVCYLALGVRVNGERDVLGMWFQASEGAKFWTQVLGDLKHRGVRDILICCQAASPDFPCPRPSNNAGGWPSNSVGRPGGLEVGYVRDG